MMRQPAMGNRRTGRSRRVPAWRPELQRAVWRRLLGTLGMLIVAVGVVLGAQALLLPLLRGPAPVDLARVAPPTGLALVVDPGFLSVDGLTSAVRVPGGATYRLPADFAPAGPQWYGVAAAYDAILGPARRIQADYTSTDRALGLTVEAITALDRPAMLYEVRAQPGTATPDRFLLLDDSVGGLALPAPVEYLALLSTGAARGTVAPASGATGVPLGDAAPVLLWSEAAGYGYVLALLDESTGRTMFRLAYTEPGTLRIRLETGPRSTLSTASPRLYVERTTTPGLTRAFAGYRAALDVLAPPPPIPATFRQQWDSWYVYGGDLDEARLRAQVDTIASTYRDLGPWQIVIDAGWYRAGADPDGEMGLVDLDKFPSGMRALVDYAHERGIGVILYGAAPWVDSDPSIGSWWVVQLGFVRDHQDWLILVSGDDDGATYVYDLSNPELRAYLAGLIRRYLVEFDADGILLDMVGIIGPEGGPFRGAVPGPMSARRPPLRGALPGGDPTASPSARRGRFGLAQTMEVYRSFWETATRLKPGVWIESGYATPPLARPYAHTWRLADDYPAFSNPYPFAGLREQITYAILQQQILGRRPHLGFIHGGEETLPIQRQWLGAAVALQAQTVLSTDLTAVAEETARMYREYLAALRPFSASPTFGHGVPPEVFSTTVDGTTYLGLLNESDEARTLTVDLAAHGRTPTPAVAFDPESGQSFTSGPYLDARVPAQSFRLLVLRAAPGLLWGDRSATAAWEGGTLRIQVEPGPLARGRLRLYAPNARAVLIDGVPALEWSLDPDTGLLTVEVPDGAAHQIQVLF